MKPYKPFCKDELYLIKNLQKNVRGRLYDSNYVDSTIPWIYYAMLHRWAEPATLKD